uniref:Uncharacterized protein n=1 Tax=Cucumis melo TaxID=3656 RepID=A0A9I9E5J0_CUCME
MVIWTMGIGQCSVSFHLQIYHTSCQCKHSKIIGLQRRLCETHNLDFDFKSVNSYGQKDFLSKSCKLKDLSVVWLAIEFSVAPTISTSFAFASSSWLATLLDCTSFETKDHGLNFDGNFGPTTLDITDSTVLYVIASTSFNKLTQVISPFVTTLMNKSLLGAWKKNIKKKLKKWPQRTSICTNFLQLGQQLDVALRATLFGCTNLETDDQQLHFDANFGPAIKDNKDSIQWYLVGSSAKQATYQHHHTNLEGRQVYGKEKKKINKGNLDLVIKSTMQHNGDMDLHHRLSYCPNNVSLQQETRLISDGPNFFLIQKPYDCNLDLKHHLSNVPAMSPFHQVQGWLSLIIFFVNSCVSISLLAKHLFCTPRLSSTTFRHQCYVISIFLFPDEVGYENDFSFKCKKGDGLLLLSNIMEEEWTEGHSGFDYQPIKTLKFFFDFLDACSTIPQQVLHVPNMNLAVLVTLATFLDCTSLETEDQHIHFAGNFGPAIKNNKDTMLWEVTASTSFIWLTKVKLSLSLLDCLLSIPFKTFELEVPISLLLRRKTDSNSCVHSRVCINAFLAVSHKSSSLRDPSSKLSNSSLSLTGTRACWESGKISSLSTESCKS